MLKHVKSQEGFACSSRPSGVANGSPDGNLGDSSGDAQLCLTTLWPSQNLYILNLDSERGSTQSSALKPT